MLALEGAGPLELWGQRGEALRLAAGSGDVEEPLVVSSEEDSVVGGGDVGAPLIPWSDKRQSRKATSCHSI